MDNLLTIFERYIYVAIVVQTLSVSFIVFDSRGPTETFHRLLWALCAFFTGPLALIVYAWRGRKPA
ncbi:MAG TPA: hypothetical protein PKO06_12765 [Candidatus Ozemobacteraceae bacterium]|nr:hypothetical protein [Candidatus Ozemobacteraceae bacterium]